MSYKMTQITDNISVGKTSDGKYDLEFWHKGLPLGAPIEVVLSEEDAKKLAEYLVRH